MKSNVDLVATLAIYQAEQQTVLATLEALLKELQLESLQGVPIRQWIYRQRLEELQTVLIQMEDLNPGAAASVQQRIDEISEMFSDEAS